jgi:hypothetical protein
MVLPPPSPIANAQRKIPLSLGGIADFSFFRVKIRLVSLRNRSAYLRKHAISLRSRSAYLRKRSVSLRNRSACLRKHAVSLRKQRVHEKLRRCNIHGYYNTAFG